MAATIRTDKIGPVSGSADFTLPTSDGSAKSALITNGSKVLSFATGTPSASNFLRGDGTWAAVAGGLSTASQWRLTANFTGTATPIATNLEEVDAPVGFGVLGSSMTESSGIFTFPSTGYWEITLVQVSNAAVRTSYNEAQIMTTTNDSTYVEAAWARSFNVSGPTTYTSSSCVYIMDVTSTSTHKVRFDIDIGVAGSITMGDSNINLTCMTFIKLADT